MAGLAQTEVGMFLGEISSRIASATSTLLRQAFSGVGEYAQRAKTFVSSLGARIQAKLAAGGAVLASVGRGGLQALGYLWNAPNTAVGIAYGLAGMTVGAAASVVAGATRVLTLGRFGAFEWYGGSISLGNNALQFVDNPLQLSAITLGNTIIYSRRAGFDPWSPRFFGNLGIEEMQHTFQGQVLGPLYLPSHMALGTASTLWNGEWHGAINVLETGPHAPSPRPWP